MFAYQKGAILSLPISAVRKSERNAEVYRPINPDDPENFELGQSIKREGIKTSARGVAGRRTTLGPSPLDYGANRVS